MKISVIIQFEGIKIINAHAKINIHLEVLNRRKDNFHNLFSLMAEVELCDILKLEDYKNSDNSGDVSVEFINGGGEFSPLFNSIPVEKNLITIAVTKYMNAVGRGGHFVFSVIKNIPSGAGLGGGSSNAASALKIISEVLNKGIDDRYFQAASETGSDVSFFINGEFAFAEGRGESVTPLKFESNSYILLVNNGIHIDTGFAYDSLKKTVSEDKIECSSRIKIITESISDKSRWKMLFKNDFEPAVFGLYPEIGKIKEKLYDNGAYFALMTGSGSTVFGLFDDEHNAVNVKKILENEGNRVYLTKFRSNKN